MFITTSGTSCSNEQHFFVLHRLKIYLRSTLLQDRPSVALLRMYYASTQFCFTAKPYWTKYLLPKLDCTFYGSTAQNSLQNRRENVSTSKNNKRFCCEEAFHLIETTWNLVAIGISKITINLFFPLHVGIPIPKASPTSLLV